jgi:pimeloyl-ACP methyl ester carboxylesterase
MFEYFPGNYVWNLSVSIALESGARIGEIDEMCRPLRDAAARGEDAGTDEFFASWIAVADRLRTLADEDVARGRAFSAATKLDRAALYYQVAERMQRHGAPARTGAFAQGQSCFRKALALSGAMCERVEIPYGGGLIPGLFTPAPEAAHGRAPVLLFVNGLDSSKELLYWIRLWRELARRGVSTLHVDQPGSGEALRAHGLTAVHDSERWASPVVDFLQTRPDVDPARIGMLGLSLGGYFVPRAVAFEPRFAMGAVWGANHDWGEVQRRRLAREGDRPVPHYWEHVRWVFGAPDMESFMEVARKLTLEGVLDRVRAPFLVTHGEHDRQIPLEWAQRTYAQLVNCPRREIKVFTARDGGVEHVSADNMANARDFIADWVAETLGGRTAQP